MHILTATGIGDAVWTLHKVQAIRDTLCPGEPIDVSLVGGNHSIDSRAVDFVRRFSFVASVDVRPYSIHKPDRMINADGTYNYLDDGWYDGFPDGRRYCILVPNRALEQGIRLESWLPHYPIRWDIWRDFSITEDERFYAEHIARRTGPFCVFYPGPLAGNTTDGHNRGGLWRPEDWIELGRRVHEQYGLRIVVVGATYDAAYWDHVLSPKLGADLHYWESLIGQTNLGQLWSVTSLAEFVVSYQAGVGIISTYLGTPTAIFWRPDGNSISPTHYLSFREPMASAWVPPNILDTGRHMPLYYGRATPAAIVAEMAHRGWVRPRVRSAS